MNIKTFAEQHRLKVTRDECGDPTIRGKLGQIYEYGSGRLAVVVMANTARYWNAARHRLMTAGCKIIQDGDSEGGALLPNDNPEQARLAIRLIRAKQRRRLSAEQLAVLRELAARARAAKRGALESGSL